MRWRMPSTHFIIDVVIICRTPWCVEAFGCLVPANKTAIQGERFREPFRRGFGYAAQWLDSLRLLVEKRVDAILDDTDVFLSTCNLGPRTTETPVFKPTLPPASSTPLCAAAHPQPSSNTSATLPSIENATLPSSLSRAAAHPHTLSNVSSISADPETSARPREPSECLRSLRQLCPATCGRPSHV